jgi:hypothetical protein
MRLLGSPRTEGNPCGPTSKASNGTLRGPAAADGLATVLNYEEAQGTRYFDTAGFPGRTMGLYLPNTTASR